MPRVDVVIPVYNEEKALPKSIPELRAFLSGSGFPYEWRIVIADNASIDDTPAVGRGLSEETPGEVEYVRIERKGRGYALKQTWSQSPADIVSYMDVDLSTGLEAFLPLIRAVAEGGYGVATGSRLARKSKVDRSLKRTAPEPRLQYDHQGDAPDALQRCAVWLQGNQPRGGAEGAASYPG